MQNRPRSLTRSERDPPPTRMTGFLNSQASREYIADLAELLRHLLKKQDPMPADSVTDCEPNESNRGRHDPVFTGGAVVGLLLTDPAAPPPSRTKDIHIVLEIAGDAEFTAMGHLLRQAGFTQNSLDDLHLCAWHWRGVRVDFLPLQPTPMMGCNRWFPDVIAEAKRIEVSTGRYAWCASAPCFIATKLEAFVSRGKGNFLMSKDIEDILAVIDGREELLSEISNASSEVRGFLKSAFRDLLIDRHFMECLPQIIPDDARELILTNRLRAVASLV